MNSGSASQRPKMSAWASIVEALQVRDVKLNNGIPIAFIGFQRSGAAKSFKRNRRKDTRKRTARWRRG